MRNALRFATLASGALVLLNAAPAYAALDCTVASMQTAVDKDTTITLAEQLTTPVPHCKVEGYVTTQNPGPNKVNFRIQLPAKDNWSKRFYFVGLGGTAGAVPTNSQIPPGNPIVKGFVVAGTDTGHQYGPGDWSFLGKNEAQTLDHVRRGGHVATLAAQAITRAYYDTPKFYRYHSGCSGGGRMGQEAITNYPGDYDGVLLGEPGGGPKFASETMLAFIDIAQQNVREPGAFVTPAKLQFVDRKVTEKCDPLDGAKDGVVWAHEVCSFDFKTLACKGADGPDCLTAPEIRTVEAIARGPHDTHGKIKDGFPITNMSTWASFTGASPEKSGAYRMGSTIAQAYFNPKFDILKDFSFKDQKTVDHYWEMTKKLDYGDSFSTDLSGLQKAGGKVLFWNGVSAPCCLDQDLLKYYTTAAKSVGGMKNFQKFAAFYKVPAIGHCGGGTGPNDHADRLLEELVAWVEQGKQPGPVVAHRGATAKSLFADPLTGTVSGVIVPASTGSARDFLLCPYPAIGKYSGKGDVNNAANWACK